MAGIDERVTVRVSAATGELLRRIGSRDHRSNTGEVEWLIMERARALGVVPDEATVAAARDGGA